MGKRKQPFGYKMKLGEIVPQPQEAETVRSIYLQYLAGVSFKQLAEQLQTEDVPYDEDKSWNKNMVARILEDDRYIGEKEFKSTPPRNAGKRCAPSISRHLRKRSYASCAAAPYPTALHEKSSRY